MKNSISSSLPSPLDLMKSIPLQEEESAFIAESREAVRNILNFRDHRHLLIVGPCSIHDLVSAWEYALRLKVLADAVNSTIFIVMRVYFEKARTSLGWQGFLSDPQLDGSHQMKEGLLLSRRFLRELALLKIPCACEFLDPMASLYIADLITWGCIGASTSASQIHRQLASSLPLPMAFKNTTEGNIEISAQGISVASAPQRYIGLDPAGKLGIQYSLGNADCHLVLRGGIDKPNYDPQSIQKTLDILGKLGLMPRLLIDCSHDNSRKIPEQQQMAFHSVIHQLLEGNLNIRGTMLESFLYGGNQQMDNASALKYGVSITDPCLDWDTTKQHILWAHEKLKHQVIPADSSQEEMQAAAITSYKASF